MRKSEREDMDRVIQNGGMVFRKTRETAESPEKRVKTKAKKKTYVTGLHGSASAKKKAEIRIKRANRHKKK